MFYRWVDNQLILECHLLPGARADSFAGVHGDRLKVRIAAPPIDGKANKRLVAFLAEAFGVPKSHVTLLHGAQSRHKRVGITRPATLPAEAGITRP